MGTNRWIGKAQPLRAKTAFVPKNVGAGSTWSLRVGASSFQYTLPASVMESRLSAENRAQQVVESLVDLVSTGAGIAGGATAAESVSAELKDGEWAVVASGSEGGEPIDVELLYEGSIEPSVSVKRLQRGEPGVTEKQRIRWPKSPTAGTLNLQFRGEQCSVAYNASASTLKTELESLSTIPGSSLVVTGDYLVGWTVEFLGSGSPGSVWGDGAIDLIEAYSEDSQDTVAISYKVTQRGGVTESEFVLTGLTGSTDDYFRFEYGGEQGHLFTGGAGVAEIESALESIDALRGNVQVFSPEESQIVIRCSGLYFSDSVDDLSVVAIGDAATPTIEFISGVSSPTQTVQEINILNAPFGGRMEFQYNSNSAFITLANFSDYANLNTVLANASIPFTVESWDFRQGKNAKIVLISNSAIRDESLVRVVNPTQNPRIVGCMAVSVERVSVRSIGRNEIQQVSLNSDPDGGTFTLTYAGQTTAALNYNASAASVESALEALSNISSGDVSVEGADGGPYVLFFGGALQNTEINSLTGNGSNLTFVDDASVDVVTIQLPTGPNWWTNAKNWSLGRIPNSSDTVVFESGSVACRYGIQDVPAFAGLKHYATFTGDIGLGEVLDDGTPQTLPRYLSLTDVGSRIDIVLGIGEGAGSGLIRIDTQLQDANVMVQSGPQAVAEGANYTVGLAGKLNTVSVGNASVGIAVESSLTATVVSARVSPSGEGTADQSTLTWGAGATIGTIEVYRTQVNGASVPSKCILRSADATIDGVGDIDLLEATDALVRYRAQGYLGKQGAIESIAVDGSNQVEVTSTAHGLKTGDAVFTRDLFGLDDGYFSVSVIDVDTFVLLASDISWIVGNGVFNAVYGGSQVAGNPMWGVADAVKLGTGSILNLSEVSVPRAIAAPILLQAVDARIIDPLQSVKDLRWRCDPGFMTEDYGRVGVFKRESVHTLNEV